MTSVSMISRSFSPATGLMMGGGASIVLGPFLTGFLSFEKKLPKKLWSSFFRSVSRSLPLLSAPGANLPDLGSTGFSGGLLAFMRSETMARALWPFKKSGWVVLM